MMRKILVSIESRDTLVSLPSIQLIHLIDLRMVEVEKKISVQLQD